MLRNIWILSGLAMVLAGGGFAQGNLCSTATSLYGTGSFAFNTTLHTTSPVTFGTGACQTVIHKDGFWQWTAPSAGDYVFDTFGTAWDTKLSVWLGSGCAATCGDHNDDTGGSQSEVHLNGLLAGDQVLIQFGGYGGLSGPGVLNIAQSTGPCVTDAFEDNDTCATPQALAPGVHINLGVTDTDPDFYSVTIPAGDMLRVDLVQISGDTDIELYDASCNLITTENFTLAYSNTSGLPETVVLGCVNYAGSPEACSRYELAYFVTLDPCIGVLDDGLENNDSCAFPYPLSPGVYPGLFVSDTDGDFYSVTIPTDHIMTVQMNQLAGDSDIYVYDSSCSLQSGHSGSFEYANTQGVPETLVLEFRKKAQDPLSCAEYNLEIRMDPSPCMGGADDFLEDSDDCASAAFVHNGTYTDLVVRMGDEDHYSTCVAAGATISVDLLFSSVFADVDLYLWDAADSGCGLVPGTTELVRSWTASDNESASWTNTTGADLDVVIEVNVWVGSLGPCTAYDLVIAGSGGCAATGGAGASFCSPASNNSTGFPAELTGSWGSGVGSDLHLEMTGGAPGQLAYMLAGNVSTSGVAYGDGLLCLVGVPIARLYRFNVPGPMNSIGGFDASGTWVNVAGTSTTGFGFDVPVTIPAAIPIAIMAGDTWHFQGWYRDTPAGVGHSNFSDGLSVTF